MKSSDDLFIKCKKDNLLNILDSGVIEDAMEQYALVDTFVLDVFRIHPKKEIFESYLDDQNRLKDKIREMGQKKSEIDKKISELVEEYGNNAREMYEQVKEKL